MAYWTGHVTLDSMTQESKLLVVHSNFREFLKQIYLEKWIF